MKKVATDVGGTFTDLVFFDQRTNEIKTAKTLTTVYNPSDGVIRSIDLASFENFVFLFGDYSERIDEVNMYNSNDDSWIKLSTNFTGRRHAAVVRNGDWIYVIGGYDGDTVFDTVEKCKPF